MAGGIIFLKPIQIDNNWKMTYTLQWNEMAGGSLFKANKIEVPHFSVWQKMGGIPQFFYHCVNLPPQLILTVP